MTEICECQRCGHKWQPVKSSKPKSCAMCTSTGWDKPSEPPKTDVEKQQLFARLQIRHKLYYENNRLRINLRNDACHKMHSQEPKRKQQVIKRNRQTMAKYPERYLARSILRSAVETGKLIRQPCEVCGNPKVEAHHPDYSKPLEVRWLCHQHHCELEGRWIAK